MAIATTAAQNRRLRFETLVGCDGDIGPLRLERNVEMHRRLDGRRISGRAYQLIGRDSHPASMRIFAAERISLD
jgi:hypothetical protein